MKKRGKKKPKRIKAKSKQSRAEKALISNFVDFQKIMIKMTSKLDELTTEISKILELFEISAKTLAEKNIETGKDTKENKEILEKLTTLFEQNKTIARGLALVYEKPHEAFIPEQKAPVFEPPVRRNLPMQYQHSQNAQMPKTAGGFQKSIHSKGESFPEGKKFERPPKE